MRHILSTSIVLVCMAATSQAQTLTANWDTFAEGSPALSITDGAITVSNLDIGMPPPTTNNFVIEQADGMLAGLPGFTPNNTLSFGGYSPGPGAATARCKSFEITWTGGAALSAQIEVYEYGSYGGNTCTLEALSSGIVMTSSSFVFSGGFTVSHHTLSVADPAGFDMLRVVGGGFSDSGVFFALVDSIQVMISAPSSGASYCFGDGTGTACPCGNASIHGSDEGCLNSLGTGGQLRSSGTASLSADTAVLLGGGMPNSSALYFQGTSDVAGGAGVVFGDGLRCVGGTMIRLGTKANVAGASHYPNAGDSPIHTRGLITGAGSLHYQVWYRNSASFCSASTFNLTNAYELIWTL